MERITGKILNKKWNVGALHSLYREDGKWFHLLERFPGALFDANGYILFATKGEYESCGHLSIGKELHVPGGISRIPGYVKVKPT